MTRQIAIEIISFLFIVLFTYAAIVKLIDYEKFVVQIGQSPLLTNFTMSVPWLIPIIEIVVSLLLSLPAFRMYGLYASLFLMSLFTAYIVAILNFSDYVPCSCGGILENMGWNEHLMFNIVFVAFAILGILMYEKPSQPEKKGLESQKE